MSTTLFRVAKNERCFEDYNAGDVYEFAETISVSEAEIIKFAEQFDPQYFHIDPEAAARSIYKGLIASGAHIIALVFRLYIEKFVPGKASLGSPGLDEVRWLKPLRPGDVLRIRVTVLETRPSSSRPDRGTVRSLVEAINQKNEVIMTLKAINIMARRSE